jgi:hypothetical protein
MSVSSGEGLIHEQTVDDEDIIYTLGLIRAVESDVNRRGDDLSTKAIFELAVRALFVANVKRAEINKPPITVALLFTAYLMDK